MFKKLRIKFIAITMIMVALVMALAFTAACISEYQRSVAVVQTALLDATEDAVAISAMDHHRPGNLGGIPPEKPSGTTSQSTSQNSDAEEADGDGDAPSVGDTDQEATASLSSLAPISDSVTSSIAKSFDSLFYSMSDQGGYSLLVHHDEPKGSIPPGSLSLHSCCWRFSASLGMTELGASLLYPRWSNAELFYGKAYADEGNALELRPQEGQPQQPDNGGQGVNAPEGQPDAGNGSQPNDSSNGGQEQQRRQTQQNQQNQQNRQNQQEQNQGQSQSQSVDIGQNQVQDENQVQGERLESAGQTSESAEPQGETHNQEQGEDDDGGDSDSGLGNKNSSTGSAASGSSSASVQEDTAASGDEPASNAAPAASGAANAQAGTASSQDGESNQDESITLDENNTSAPAPPEIGNRQGVQRTSSSLVPVAVYSLSSDGTLSVVPQVTSASISDDILKQAAQLARANEDGYGTFNDLGLHYYKKTEGDTVYFAFADTSYTDSWMSLASVLVAAGTGTLVLFFVICLFYSKWALRPVREAWDSQRQFVADASHDLKTPLTVILANSSILLKHPDHTIASESQWIESTQKEADEMQGLVNEMLELAQIEAGQKLDIVREPIDFSDLVDGETLLFDSVALERSCEFDCSIEEGITILGNDKQVKKMVSTLVENAFKYVDDGGAIQITLKRMAKNAVLSIRNTGSIIAEDDLPHIFDRFYRTDKARTSGTGGFGLGLAIAREVALQHGGDITCASSEENGTTFTITIPAT